MQEDTTQPVKKEDIPTETDAKIDQDFPGFPNGPAEEKLITPKTEEDKKLAQVNIKDGEKVNRHDEDEVDEGQSDGSGGAFDSTENTGDDDYDNSRSGK